MKENEFFPPRFNTKAHALKAHFENYNETPKYENSEPEFDPVRREIAEYFSVPFDETESEKDLYEADPEQNHIFIVDNKLIPEQRNVRAFCAITREQNGKKDAWYIDGRTAHAVLLRRLYSYYKVPDDEANSIYLGFLDYEGFPDIKEIQEEARRRGHPITWFIRDAVSPHQKTVPQDEHFLTKIRGL